MGYGVLITTTIIMAAVLINYFKDKHLPVMSSKLFFCFLSFASLNLLTEWFAQITLRYCDWDSYIVRFAHQLFVASLIAAIYFLFLYVDMKSRVQERYCLKGLLVRILPFVLSIILVIFAPIKFYEGKNDVYYSKGLMVYLAYVAVVIYTIFILIIVTKRKNFNLGEKISIYFGTLGLIAIGSIEFFFPEILISSAGIVLVTLFLTLSVENTHDYLDFEIKTALNVYAFKEMLSELYAKGIDFYVINYVANSTYHDETIKILNNINANYLKYPTYISHEGVLTVFFVKKELFDLNIKIIENELEKDSNVNYYISVVECPKYIEDKKDFIDYIEYIKHSFEYENVLNYYGEDDVKAKNYNKMVEQILRQALKDEGFMIYYQPIYSIENKIFESAEALIRLKDNKTIGYISPEVFIPIAERIGIINEITTLVLEMICRDMSNNYFSSYGIKYIEMNISGIDATNIELPIKFNECLKKYNVKPQEINIEITETASVSSMEKFEYTMNAFRKYGYKFSMDDFGTGYSNFKKLSETPFELIKIDKSLIWPSFDEKNERKEISKNILKECIEIIHSIGSSIVAEGVETKEMFEFLRKNKVEHIQGYYFSKPLDVDSFVEFLKKNNK